MSVIFLFPIDISTAVNKLQIAPVYTIDWQSDFNVYTVAQMPNQGDEAADGSPADIPCLEKLDSPSGNKVILQWFWFLGLSWHI